MPQSNEVYCFNPTCPAPANAAGRTACHTCGAELVLKGRYRGMRPLGQKRAIRIFLALDHQASERPHCIIQQFCGQSYEAAVPLISQLERLGRHPQIPSWQDCFEQDGSLYWVQDYIQGQTLATRLQQTGKLNPAEVWQVLETLLPILQFVHAHQVIHGDIKPANIIAPAQETSDLGPEGTQKATFLTLVDFSTAKLADNGMLFTLDPTLGNAAFTAPEQLRGEPAFASDLYSLGVTCLNLLTALHPFDLIDAVNNRWAWRNFWSPEGLQDSEDNLHLADVLDRLIAPDLDQRFASAEAAIAHVQNLRNKQIPIPAPVPMWSCSATLVSPGGLASAFNAVGIDPSGQWVAGGGEDATVQIWDVQTGSVQFTLRGHDRAVLCLAFAPNNPNCLATGSRDRTLKLWDLQTYQVTHTLIGHQHRVHALAFSPDGNCLASGSADKTVKLWNPATGMLLATLSGPKLGMTAIAFSPTMPILAGASLDASIQVWDRNTLEPIYTLTEHTAAVKAIAFSPDGRLLATGGDDRTIRLWNTLDWQCRSILSGHPWCISSLVFSPDGTFLFSSSWDNTIKVWQVQTGKAIETLVGHCDIANGIAMMPNGRGLASSSLDKTVRLWRC